MLSPLSKQLNLEPDEKIIKVVREYPLTYSLPIFLSALLILAPFFFLFLLFSWGAVGVIIFSLTLIFGIIYALKIFINWYFNAFVLTAKRIIDITQKGFFERLVMETSYEKIQDISFRQKGFWQMFYHYGDIEAVLVNNQKLKLANVKKPHQIKELIINLQKTKKTIGPSIIQKDQRAEWKEGLESLSVSELLDLSKEVQKKIEEKMSNLS